MHTTKMKPLKKLMDYVTPAPFRSYVKHRKIRANVSGGFTPTQLRQYYNFPTNYNGTGKTVGFIELGGSFNQNDLNTYCSSLGFTAPTVQFVGIQGQTNTPHNPSDADVEVMLDLCCAIGVAPGIQAIVFKAPNSDSGFAAAINAAVAAKVDAISISWGGPEDGWDSAGISSMNAAIQAAAAAGIPVFVAAGDNGSGDGESGNHVDFPGSSPYATSCGGTTLNVSNGVVTSEMVWNDGTDGGATGGGVSTLFPIPSYQNPAVVPGKTMRGIPDVSGVADPETGILIIANGQQQVVGGTSGVAPFWAGLYCVLSQAAGKNLGFLNPILYPLGEAGFRDITSGNNGTYVAQAGWDCCTGLGSPLGAQLLALLTSNSTPTPVPTPAPVPAPTPTPVPSPIPVSVVISYVDQAFAEIESEIGNRPEILWVAKWINSRIDKWIQANYPSSLAFRVSLLGAVPVSVIDIFNAACQAAEKDYPDYATEIALLQAMADRWLPKL